MFMIPKFYITLISKKSSNSWKDSLKLKNYNTDPLSFYIYIYIY